MHPVLKGRKTTTISLIENGDEENVSTYKTIDDENEQDESPVENWINEHLGLVFVLVFGVLSLVIIIIVVVKKNRL